MICGNQDNLRVLVINVLDESPCNQTRHVQYQPKTFYLLVSLGCESSPPTWLLKYSIALYLEISMFFRGIKQDSDNA